MQTPNYKFLMNLQLVQHYSCFGRFSFYRRKCFVWLSELTTSKFNSCQLLLSHIVYLLLCYAAHLLKKRKRYLLKTINSQLLRILSKYFRMSFFVVIITKNFYSNKRYYFNSASVFA